MKMFHSLPNPKEMGFEWPEFEKALERIGNVATRRRQAERTAGERTPEEPPKGPSAVEKLRDFVLYGPEDAT